MNIEKREAGSGKRESYWLDKYCYPITPRFPREKYMLSFRTVWRETHGFCSYFCYVITSNLLIIVIIIIMVVIVIVTMIIIIKSLPKTPSASSTPSQNYHHHVIIAGGCRSPDEIVLRSNKDDEDHVNRLAQNAKFYCYTVMLCIVYFMHSSIFKTLWKSLLSPVTHIAWRYCTHVHMIVHVPLSHQFEIKSLHRFHKNGLQI